METLSDRDFENIAIRHKYLSQEELEKCQELKKTECRGKSLCDIALAEQMIEEEDFKGMIEIAGSKVLIFGGYEVTSILGEGGLGVVYRAKQLSMKRYVALKVLYPKWMKDEEFRKRFLLEARIAGKLSHPNLIQVFDIGYDKGRYYFSMEYVPGHTIDSIIHK